MVRTVCGRRDKLEMARNLENPSNEFFEVYQVLADWEHQLRHAHLTVEELSL